MPGTFFSLKLGYTIQEHCTRGLISKEACACGFRAAFEPDFKMVLPDFSCLVCPDIA